MKKFLALLLLSAAPAQAQYFSSPPNVFTDGTSCAPGCAVQMMADLNQIISDGNAAYTALAAAIAALPAGTTIPSQAVMMYNNSGTCPTGYVQMTGANGTINLSGYYIRAWDHGRGVDPGRAWGSSQGQSFATHTHNNATLLYIAGLAWANANPSGASTQAAMNSANGGIFVTGTASAGSPDSSTYPDYYVRPFCMKS